MKRLFFLILLVVLSGSSGFVGSQEAYLFPTRSFRATPSKADLSDLSSLQALEGSLNQSSFVLSVEQAKGKIYAYTGTSFFNMVMPAAFSQLSVRENVLTDEILDVYNLNNYLFYDMAYDAAEDVMYAIGNLRSVSNVAGTILFKVDLGQKIADSAGAFEIVGNLPESLCAFAVDMGGYMFGIGTTGRLYMIDKENLAYTFVGETGVVPSLQYQNMEFDHRTGDLYWSTVPQGGKPTLYRVNTLTGEAEKKAEYPGEADFVNGLCIPFDPGQDVPSAVSGLTCVANVREMTLSWDNPVKTYAGAEGTALSKIEIYRDGTLLRTLTDNLAAGAHCQEILSEEPEGLHHYQVVAYNAAGKGVLTGVRIWAGYDVPAAVSDLEAEVEGMQVTLRWSPVSTGLFGGTVREDEIGYRITRFPDNRIFETGETFFEDREISRLSNYSYQVVAYTSDGDGAASSVGPFLLGEPYQDAFHIDFSNPLDWSQWTVEDVNSDLITWEEGSYLGEKGALIATNPNTADDWLYTPPVRLKPGTYSLFYRVGTLYYDFTENMVVAVGKAPVSDSMVQEIKTVDVRVTDPQQRDLTFSVSEEGVYHIGFHCVSVSPESAGIFLTDFVLYPNNSKDLALVGSEVPEYLIKGKDNKLKFTVANPGKEMIYQYKIKLLDESGTVLDEASNLMPVPFNATSTFTFNYRPQETGNAKVRALLSYDGDVFPKNDTSFVLDFDVRDTCFSFMSSKGNALRQNGIPAMFGSSSSASQSIYTAEELGLKPGLATRLMLDFENANAIEEKRPLEIYLANTSESTLEAGWIMPEDFSLVYSDTVTFDKLRNRVYLDLDPTFIYKGENICMMVIAPTYPVFFGSFHYWLSYERAGGSRYWVYNNGDPSSEFSVSYPGILADYVPDIALTVDGCNGAALSGTVVSAVDAAPMKGVAVSVASMGISTLTDAQGKWAFDFVAVSDSLKVGFSYFGYADTTVVLDFQADTSITVGMVLRQRCDLSGKVLDRQGNPIDGAQVRISGYETHTAISNAEGMFTIRDCYEYGNYQIEIFKPRYVLLTQSGVEASSDGKVQEFILSDKLLPVKAVNARENGGGVQVSWTPADGYETLRYDNGVPYLAYGDERGTGKTVLGVVYRQASRVRSMSWMTIEYNGMKHEKVNLFVFDLTEDGYPTRTLLYQKNDVANIDSVWMTYRFEEEIVAPRGFMVALSYYQDGMGYLAVANDDQTVSSEYPFVPNTQYYCENYTLDPFVTIESQGFSSNMFIRAEAEEYSMLGFPEQEKAKADIRQKSQEGYSVWRLSALQTGETADWVKIGSTSVSDTVLTDSDWAEAASDFYRYAVRADYGGGMSSEAVFSAMLAKDMDVDLSLRLFTNLEGVKAEGATVLLVNKDYGDFNYRFVSDAEGQVRADVVKGNYTMSVSLPGFVPISREVRLEKDLENLSDTLFERVCQPVDLKIGLVDGDDWMLTWKEGCAEKGAKALVRYEVYLGESKVAEVTRPSYVFENLEKGRYTAGVKGVYESGSSAMSTLDFEVGGASNEGHREVRVLIYPNPTDGRLRIDAGYAGYGRMEVLDLRGRRVFVSDSPLSEIDLSCLAKGMYFMRVFLNTGEVHSEKVVIR